MEPEERNPGISNVELLQVNRDDLKPESSGRRVENFINNERFIEQVDEVTKLKQFLFKEKVLLSREQLDQIELGGLNNLQYKGDGREPTLAEWRELDDKYAAVISCLDLPLRRKIRIRELGFFFGQLPLILLAFCAGLTILWLMSGTIVTTGTIFGSFVWSVTLLGWTISQGALGACAFLGTSVISTRTVEVVGPKASDPKLTDPKAAATLDEIDVTDLNVLRIRVISGALFAFLIGFIFSSQALVTIWQALSSAGASIAPETLGNATQGGAAPTLTHIAAVFLPFLVGFSTNFVLSVMNRIIVALQILLGMTTRIQ